MSNLKYTVIEHISELSEKKKGKREVNIIRWENGKPQMDIRIWKPDGTMGRGISLNEEECRVLLRILQDRYGVQSEEEEAVSIRNCMPTIEDVTKVLSTMDVDTYGENW